MSHYLEGGAAAEMLERRWFATLKAASAARAECEALLEAMEMTEVAWHRARVRLAELESLRDALGDQLTEIDGQCLAPTPRVPLRRAIVSAA